MPSESWSSPGQYEWTAPNGVESIQVTLNGAGGGNGGYEGGAPGAGGSVTATIPVSPGDTLTIWVAESGDDGAYTDALGGTGQHVGGDSIYNGNTANSGGGGGGSTSVLDTNDNILAIADGGGGGGSSTAADGGNNGGGGGARNGAGGSGTGDGVDGEDGGWTSGFGGDGGDGGGNPGGDGGAATAGAATNATITTGGGNTGDADVTFQYNTLPYAPTNVSQTIEGDDQIEVNASENPNGGAYDNYRVEVSEDGGGWTHAASPASMPYTYSASTSVDEHRFRVRGEQDDGDTSNWTDTTTKSTDITSLNVSNTDVTSFDLDWDAVDDTNDYDVLLAEASGSTETDYSVDQTDTGTSATVTGLEHGERYYARVIARYPQADSLSPEADAETSLPSPTLDAVTAGSREVTVAYTLPDNSSDGDVTIELSTDGGLTWPHSQTVTDLSQTQVTFSGLLDGEVYTARAVRSTDHTSATSGTASAQTELPAPTDHQYANVTETGADHSWTANHNNGTTKIQARYDGGSWGDVVTGLDRSTETHTIASFLHGEEYDIRVVAETEHTQTEDN